MQALILSPTRELAAQTTKTILAVGDFAKISAHTCIGGTSLGAHAPSHSATQATNEPVESRAARHIREPSTEACDMFKQQVFLEMVCCVQGGARECKGRLEVG